MAKKRKTRFIGFWEHRLTELKPKEIILVDESKISRVYEASKKLKIGIKCVLNSDSLKFLVSKK